MAGKVVCVTGASGFIASWLVKHLLQRGYTVRAAVRSPDNLNKVGHLMELEGAKENLQLFKADLLDEGSYDKALNGCEGVFHTASPFFFKTENPQADLLDPAIKGTINVLKACTKAKSVKRVVLTSSTAAVMWNDKIKPEDVVDESFYSDPEYLIKINHWYALSKTLAEKTAWEYSEEDSLNLVTINPAMVVGPLLQSTMNTSSEVILNFLTGKVTTYQNASLGWVDVKDVAKAHILAYEEPTASGRYICVERVLHYADIVDFLHQNYPGYPIPTKCVDEDSPRAPVYKFNTEKVQKLGLKYTPIEVSIKDCVESLKARNLLPII